MTRKWNQTSLCLLVASSIGLAAATPTKSYEETRAAKLLRELDKNGDGRFEKREDERRWNRLARLDTNMDGALTLEELSKAKAEYMASQGEKKLNIRYKQTLQGDLHLDLYYPVKEPAGKCPVIVYTHGGGWTAGSKQGAAVGTHGQAMLKLVQAGFCVASVDYRLCRKDSNVAMRDCVIDSKDAIRYLAKNSETLGVDPQRVFSFGDSAGGQIAQMLLLSSPENLPGDPKLAGTQYRMVAGVSYYGPCDFEDTQLFSHDDRPDFRDRFAGRIVPPGTDPKKKTALVREMSPVNYLTANSPPLLMIQGDRDKTIPVKHAYRMQDEAAGVKAPVEIMIIKNAGHNWRRVGADIEPSREDIVERTVSFFVEHAGLGAGAPAGRRAECATGLAASERLPDFSWNTVPRYMHVRKSTAFTPAEIKYLASFPLITFEKSTGAREFGSTEAGTLRAATAVKRLSPRTKILYYRNILVHYEAYAANKKLAAIEQPFLVGKRGNTKLVRRRLPAYDLSNPATQTWWLDHVAEVCSSPHIDGLFIDGNIKVLERGYLLREVGKKKKDAVAEAYGRMMRELPRKLGPERLTLANIIRARFPQSGLEYVGYFDGSYTEGFEHPVGGVSREDYIAKGIAAFQEAARAGKIIAFTVGTGKATESEMSIDETRAKVADLGAIQPRLTYTLALFLICAEEYSYFLASDGYDVDGERNAMWMRCIPEYTRPLGPPKGPAVRDGYTYWREFEHARVEVDIKNERGEIMWTAR